MDGVEAKEFCSFVAHLNWSTYTESLKSVTFVIFGLLTHIAAPSKNPVSLVGGLSSQLLQSDLFHDL